jgi:Periplasmic glycine betaine/choline-binding (lipo)protein of an ABC-type transport system (osmoprotectant binding protein)
MKKILAAVLTLGLVAALFASFTGFGKNNPLSVSAKSTPITIGSKDFTENLIVAEVYADALEAHGYKVNRKFNIGSSIIHQAITSGQIDLYPEYTGTALLTILKHSLVTDPKKVYDIVKAQYKSKYNIIWLNDSPANDSQGLVIATSVAKKYKIKTISDLQKNAGKIRFASQGEFDQRSDGLPALIKTYGKFNFKSEAIYDNSLKYQILSTGKADLAVAYTTEGQLVDPKYLVLVDDKHVWPPYNLAPIVRKAALDKNPGISNILNQVSALIDTKAITALNAKVDVDKQEYEDVAKNFYKSIKGKIKG